MNRSALRRGVSFTALAVVCFALSPQARATCQEGCLPNNNTALGDDALLNDGFGYQNTAIGFQALLNNTDGIEDTAVGFQALFSNTVGVGNEAIGTAALFSNTTGILNAANGQGALYHNTTGSRNTGNGYGALSNNTTSDNNTATGSAALFYNTTGSSNTAVGASAMGGDEFNFSTGSNNTACGYQALNIYTTGNSNTAVGSGALLNDTTGSNNIALGMGAGGNLTTGRNNIDIGHAGVAGEANKIRIGTGGIQKATFIAGISGVTVPSGVGVIIGTDGKLGTVVSSARFKQDIRPMDEASEAILALKPVTFRYKHDLDPDGIAQFGLVAEDVENVNPALVARDPDGKPYSVRYEAVNAMLLNEFLKEHREVQQQKTTIAELRSALTQQQKDFQATAARQQKQIEALTAGLQKVSAQLEMSAASLQTTANNHYGRK